MGELPLSSQKAQFKCDLNKGVALSYDNSSALCSLYCADGYVSGLSQT